MDMILDRALKQRLLGAIILAALLVILVPEWLDGAGHSARYPQRIEMRDKPVFLPMDEVIEAEAKNSVKSTIKTAAPEVNTRKRASIQAWALQVGSFSDRANADVLKDRLMAKDFPAYVDVLKTPKNSTYRVRIGPELDRARLEKLKLKVLELEKLEGMIVNHP